MTHTTLMMVTDGRWDYLADALASAEANLDCRWADKVLVDDTGTGQAEHAIGRLDGWRVVANPERRGLAGAIQAGWEALDPTTDYVFHAEDDFVYPQRVDVGDMIAKLAAHPELAQVALLRQGWSPEERRAGGIYGLHSTGIRERDGLVWHSRLFTFNPCVYPRTITDYGAGLEAELTDTLTANGYRFAYYGGLDDPPRCWHIGVRRSEGYRW